MSKVSIIEPNCPIKNNGQWYSMLELKDIARKYQVKLTKDNPDNGLKTKKQLCDSIKQAIKNKKENTPLIKPKTIKTQMDILSDDEIYLKAESSKIVLPETSGYIRKTREVESSDLDQDLLDLKLLENNNSDNNLTEIEGDDVDKIEETESDNEIEGNNEVEEDEEFLKFDEPWKKLNKKLAKCLGNDNYYYLDCGAGGDCQFHSIARALTDADVKLTAADIRNDLALYIRTNKYLPLEELSFYIDYLYKNNPDFKQLYKWDLSTLLGYISNNDELKAKNYLASQIEKMGNHYQGDQLSLILISKYYYVNIIVIDEDTVSIINVPEDIDNNKDTIILLYTGKLDIGHYLLVGYYSDITNKIEVIQKNSIYKDNNQLKYTEICRNRKIKN